MIVWPIRGDCTFLNNWRNRKSVLKTGAATVFFEWVFLNSKHGYYEPINEPNISPCFLCAVCKGLYAMEPLEFVYSPLSLILHSLSLAWLAKVAQTERSNASTFDLYYTLTVTRTLLLGFLCVLHPDGPKALSQGNWHSLLFWGYMLGMLLLGAVQLLFVDVTALYFSALPAAVLHATRGLVLPLFSLL